MSFLGRLWILACLVPVACGGATSTSATNTDRSEPEAARAPDASTSTSGASSRPAQGPDVCVGVGTGAPACEPALDVGSVEELVDVMAAVKSFDQRVVGAAPATDQAPSRDVRVTAALTIDVDVLRAKSPRCAVESDAGQLDRCTETLFAPEKTFQVIRTFYGSLGRSYPPGVTCVEQVSAPFASGCRRISVEAGSVVRLQMVSERNSMANTTTNYLRLVRPCAAPCAEDETRCAASGLCVDSGPDFCILCEGRSELECACRVRCQAAKNGEECVASTSEDVVVSGRCQQGSCVE